MEEDISKVNTSLVDSGMEGTTTTHPHNEEDDNNNNNNNNNNNKCKQLSAEEYEQLVRKCEMKLDAQRQEYDSSIDTLKGQLSEVRNEVSKKWKKMSKQFLQSQN